MRFDEKVVIVTGAGAGIGKATALAFAQRGAIVTVNSRSEKSGLETLKSVRETGAKAIFVQADVGNETDAHRLVNETEKAFGRLDVLVNNAGIVLPGMIENTTATDFSETLRVNVLGAFFVSQAATELLKSTHGCIVNNASVSAIKGAKNRIAYSASKGALVSMTRAMALELMPYGVRVNCICPGMTYTESFEQRIADTGDPDVVKKFLSAIPIGRFGKPEEIANAILFAAWEGVGFMNGAVIPVDGGKSI